MDTLKTTTYMGNDHTADPAQVAYLILGKEIFFSGIERTFATTIQVVENVIAAICQAENIQQGDYSFYDIETRIQYPLHRHEPGYYCVDLVVFGGEEGTEWHCVATSDEEAYLYTEEWTENIPLALTAFGEYIAQDTPDMPLPPAPDPEEQARKTQELRDFLLKQHNLTAEAAEQFSTEFIIACDRYHIDQSFWSNPGVYTYVNLLVRAEALQMDLSIGDSRHSGYWISPATGGGLPDDEVYEDALAMHKMGLKENNTQLFRPANALTAQKTYGIAEVLMRCVVAMLQDGLSGRKEGKHYIQGKANAALEAYNLTVTDESNK